MSKRLFHNTCFAGRRLGYVSLSLLILFLSFFISESEGYSQCAPLAPSAPTGLTLTAISTTAPTTTPNVNGSGLVAYWKFDEGSGTTACDSSGKGNNGTLTNGPLWTTGKVGKALYFDGTDDNVTVLASNSLNLSNAFTLSAWVNPASTFTDFRSIVAKNYSYYLYASSTGFCNDGTPMGGLYNGQDSAACQPSPLSINSWTHLVVTYNGSTLTLYRNGVAAATYDVSQTLSASTGTLQIGASQFGEYFKGLIDEVRVYNRALSSTEIQTIYQQESVETSQIVAAPLIAPTGGSFSGSIPVTMQTATSGASIYYTTNGSTPTQSSALYTGNMTLTSSATVKAKAFKSSYTASGESSASFTVSQPFDFSIANSGNKSVAGGSSVTNSISTAMVSGATQAVSFSVSGLPTGATGSFSSASCSPACSTVLNITTTGSTPGGSFPITVTSTGGGVTKTTGFTLSVTLALTVATPTITPNGGNFSGSTSVTMQTATSGASIYYTTDGSTPTQSSALYTGAMSLTSSTTVNAKAFKSGSNPSALASASFTNSGSGTTYYVAKTGSDSNSCAQAQNQTTPKLTITAAIACLSGGDTLTIKAGTYTENIGNSNMSASQSGTSWNNATTIQAYGSDVVRVSGIGLPSPGNGLARRYIVFRNLIVNGVSIGGGANGGAVDHIKLDGLEVVGAPLSGIYIGGDDGTGTDNWVTNSRVHDNGTINDGIAHHGIYVETPNNIIENSEIYNNPGYGIHQYGGPGSTGNNIYRYNYIHDNNFSTQTVWAILLMYRNNNQVYGNIVANNQNGITSSSGGNLIYNNTVYGNGLNGSCGTKCDYAIQLWGSTNSIVKNNILFGNSINSVANTGTGSVISNNLTGDPKFIDPAANNFKLQSTSPAIDAGTPNIFSGITITFNGPAPDIGAFEY